MVEQKLLVGGHDGQGNDVVDPAEIQMDTNIGEKDFTAKRGHRMSLSPVMQQIMQKQIEAIQEQIINYQVLPLRNTTKYNYDDVPGHIDILLFGPAGAGKTSLIKTFYRALHQKQQLPKQLAESLTVKSRDRNEGTTEFTRVTIKPEYDPEALVSNENAGKEKKKKVPHDEEEKEHQIIVHDTRGQIWMDDRELNQLNLVIDGKVADKSLVEQRNYRYAYLLWEFWKRDTELFPPNIIREGRGLKTKPHCICFVFDGSMDEIPNGEEETNFYKEIITLARDRKYYYPQIVLTCIDKVEQIMLEEEEERLGRPLDDFEREQRLREIIDMKIEKVVLNLGISRSSVHFVENYKSVLDIEQSGQKIEDLEEEDRDAYL